MSDKFTQGMVYNGAELPQAGLTVIGDVVENHTSGYRQIYNKVLIRYHCCDSEKMVTVDNIMRRLRNGARRCRKCQMQEAMKNKAGFAAVRPPMSMYGVVPPTWPVPPSVLTHPPRMF